MAGLRQRAVAEDGWDHAGSEVAPGRGQLPPPEVARHPNGQNGVEPTVSGLVHATVETQVIPRLVMAHRAAAERARTPAPGGEAPDAGEVAQLASLVLEREATVASSFVDALRVRGTPAETLYLDLLAPTARRLGEFWNQDLCHFAEVTLGMVRLQQVLRDLSPTFQNEVECLRDGRRALLTPVPGEQHTFGLVMVVEFFRRAGWDVWCGPFASVAELASLVRREWFAVAGISLSGERRLDALASGIRAVRRASCNRSIGVMVGGPIFAERPELAEDVGADATAVDGRQAVKQAQDLLAHLAGER